MKDCPNCEYHKNRAQLWRDEAYKFGGHELPNRSESKPWFNLTDDEINEIPFTSVTLHGFARLVEKKLKDINSE